MLSTNLRYNTYSGTQHFWGFVIWGGMDGWFFEIPPYAACIKAVMAADLCQYSKYQKTLE